MQNTKLRFIVLLAGWLFLPCAVAAASGYASYPPNYPFGQAGDSANNWNGYDGFPGDTPPGTPGAPPGTPPNGGPGGNGHPNSVGGTAARGGMERLREAMAVGGATELVERAEVVAEPELTAARGILTGVTAGGEETPPDPAGAEVVAREARAGMLLAPTPTEATEGKEAMVPPVSSGEGMVAEAAVAGMV